MFEQCSCGEWDGEMIYETCTRCNGTGDAGETTYCYTCNATGEVCAYCLGEGCENCDYEGTPAPYVCSSCNGTGYIQTDITPCDSCSGTGRKTISSSQIRCVGTGPSTGLYFSLDLPDKFLCTSCHGEGRVPTGSYTTCTQCSGKGYVNESFVCTSCNGSGINCAKCSNTNHPGYLACTACEGTGKIYEYETCECMTNGKELTIFTNKTQNSVTDEICAELINSKYRVYSQNVTADDHVFNFGGYTSHPNDSVVEMLWTLSPTLGELEKAPSNESVFYYISYNSSNSGSSGSGGGVGGGSECLSADTLITMYDGSLKRIDSLKRAVLFFFLLTLGLS